MDRRSLLGRRFTLAKQCNQTQETGQVSFVLRLAPRPLGVPDDAGLEDDCPDQRRQRDLEQASGDPMEARKRRARIVISVA